MIDPQFLTLGGLSLAETAKQDADTQKLGNDFDDFLNLLTTQLQNQDPLNPLDSKEFTDQLIGFSQVEQQISQNSKLEQLLGLQRASTINGAVGFLGKTIQYEGSKFSYDGSGNADMSYFISEPAGQTKISILDKQGDVVRTIDGAVAAGEHLFAWDGLDNQGNPVEPGQYELQVGAQNAEGRAIQTSSLVPGLVDGIEVIDGSVALKIKDLIVGIDTVLSVRG